MSVLSLIQSHCRRHALNSPTSVISATDTTTIQLYEDLLQVIDQIVQQSKFGVATREALWTATATEDQGALTTLAPYGMIAIINKTLWDRTNRRPLYGPISEQDWQSLKALPNPGPWYKYRLRGGHFLVNPAPSGTLPTFVFEYTSSWAFTDSSGGTPKATPTLDSDLCVIPDRILRAGLAYYWKRDQGLPYQADETEFYQLLNNFIATNKTGQVINVANPSPVDLKPGIMIPLANWFG
jgi:hypothetical protein